MSLLNDARAILYRIQPVNDGMCDVCHAFGFGIDPAATHASDCAWFAMPKIVRALELIDQGISELGDHPVCEPTTGYGRGFYHALSDVCLWCGVSSYGGHPHYEWCEWPELVGLIKGEVVPQDQGLTGTTS